MLAVPGLSTELSLITLHWFLTAFASVVHIKLLLRLWDLFFYEGSLVLFQATLGMLRLKVPLPPRPRATPPIFPTKTRSPVCQMQPLAPLLWGTRGSGFSSMWPEHWSLLKAPLPPAGWTPLSSADHPGKSHVPGMVTGLSARQ